MTTREYEHWTDPAAKPMTYGLLARLNDWLQAVRDGKRGLPSTAHPALLRDDDGEIQQPRTDVSATDYLTSRPVKPVRTPHQNVLRNLGKERSEQERIWHLRRTAEVEQARQKDLATFAQTPAQAQEALNRAIEAEHALAKELPADQLDERRLGERDTPIEIVRRRRTREREKRLTAARERLSAAERTFAEVATEQARKDEASRRAATALEARQELIRQHHKRRQDSYLRTLVRVHRDREELLERLERGVSPIEGMPIHGEGDR